MQGAAAIAWKWEMFTIQSQCQADASMQGADVYNAVTMARGQKSPLLLSTDKCEYE